MNCCHAKPRTIAPRVSHPERSVAPRSRRICAEYAAQLSGEDPSAALRTASLGIVALTATRLGLSKSEAASLAGLGFASGFTLLELILVMLIIAIAAAVVVPSLSEFAIGRSSENAAQQVLNLAQYARSQCVSEGRTYRMNFDQQAGQVWLTVGTAGTFSPVSNDFGSKYSLADGMKMTVQITPQPNTVLVMTPTITPTDVQPVPQFGQPVWPLMNTVMQLPRSDGTYVEFQPSGRIDPALIKLVDKRGKEIDIGAATSTEPLHVVTAMEMR